MDWNKLFNDFADKYYAVPDFTNEEHVYALQNYLIEQGMLTEDVDYAIKTLLFEAPKKPTNPKIAKQAKDMGLKWKGKGYGPENVNKVTHKVAGDKLVAVDDEKGDDKEKGGEEKPKDDDRPINLAKGGKVDAQLGGDRGAGPNDMMDKDEVGKIKDNEPKEPKQKKSKLDRTSFGEKQKIYKDNPTGPTQKELLDDLNSGNIDVIVDYQTKLQEERAKGNAGMGGAVASEGESKYCDGTNEDIDKWTEEKKYTIDKKREELKSSSRNAEEKRTAKALGLKSDSDEFLDYLAKREAWAEEKLEEARNNPDHVFFLKGKKGFNGDDEAYKAWMRVAYDGAITTKKKIKESDIDTTKPHHTVQSTTELDESVEAHLEDQTQKVCSLDNKSDDCKYYKKELKLFKKHRKYHDTYCLGKDENGRTCIVSISNKKEGLMTDPHNNTTPAQRLRMIKKLFGLKVAENVSRVIDAGINRVSNAAADSIAKQTIMKIDDDIVEACETKQMKKYMSDLDNKASDTRVDKFGNKLGSWLTSQKPPKDWSKMSTKEKLEAMQEYANSKLYDSDNNPRLKEEEDGTYYKTDDGEYVKIKNLGQIGLPYEPFGKIAIKLGEFKINDETSAIKQNEKNIVKETHKDVVDSLINEDQPDGYHPDKNPEADNGPNTSGYIRGVLEAMHAISYIDTEDEDNDRMLIQMGINGVDSKMVRECLAEKSGFKGDVNSVGGRRQLKEHLQKRCRVKPGEDRVSVVDSEGNDNELFNDEWRTAGTSQKVASGYGKSMRECLTEKARQ